MLFSFLLVTELEVQAELGMCFRRCLKEIQASLRWGGVGNSQKLKQNIKIYQNNTYFFFSWNLLRMWPAGKFGKLGICCNQHLNCILLWLTVCHYWTVCLLYAYCYFSVSLSSEQCQTDVYILCTPCLRTTQDWKYREIFYLKHHTFTMTSAVTSGFSLLALVGRMHAYSVQSLENVLLIFPYVCSLQHSETSVSLELRRTYRSSTAKDNLSAL